MNKHQKYYTIKPKNLKVTTINKMTSIVENHKNKNKNVNIKSVKKYEHK